MKQIWNSSFGFPQPRPVGPFLDYIRDNNFRADHFFSAYPYAANTEVLAALESHRLLRTLCDAAPTVTAEELRHQFDDMLIQMQRRPAPLRPERQPRGDVCGDKYAFTALTPVRPRDVPALRDLLCGLSDAGSPFAGVPGLHFARWVLVDDVVYQGPAQRRDSWRNAYLLTSTTTDGTTAPLKDLYAGLGPAADDVMRHCIGYPGRDDEDAFVRYFRHNQVRTNRFFSGYPHATVADVRTALDTHERILEFAQRQQRIQDARTFEAAFVATFCRTEGH
jgi:hypothetical protein